jgi:hypothetical protein
MDHALGDALAVEACELLDQVMVLHQHRAGGPAVCECWLFSTGALLSVVSLRVSVMGLSACLFRSLEFWP